MSKYNFTVATITPSAIADATNLTTGTFLAVQGGNATQCNNLWSIAMVGQATSSNVNIMLVGVDSTVFATPTALATPNSYGPLNPNANAVTAPAVACIAATTLPQRSATITKAKDICPFNAFGGGYYWHAYDASETFQIFGNALNFGEFSLSGFTGTGASGPCSVKLCVETI